ncbi:MAG: hypothetical protein H0X04_00240 [Chthoniobacterales bacterium]|nr:hypothetical protein [Chthoniobacterales bacterium]
MSQGDGLPCGGYFDDRKKQLVVAYKSAAWLETLAHEYCHMVQWKNGHEFWRNTGRRDDIFFDWIAGRKNPGVAETNRASTQQLEVELDCEKATVRTILAWKLKIDIPVYIRSANCYVLWYTFLKYYGVWYDESPEDCAAIHKLMPKTFQRREWYDSIPREYLRLIWEHCVTSRAKYKRAAKNLLRHF